MGLYRRNGIWWARAERSGREFRQSLKTRDRRLAERRHREWLEQLGAASWGDRPRVAFKQALKAFLLEHAVTLKPSAAKRYGVSVKWLNDKFGDGFIDDVDRKSLAEFETWRRAMGAKPPTIRRDLACLSSILAMCEDKDWLEEGRNPVRGYMKRRAKRGLKEAPGRTRYLTEAEEAALLAEASPLARAAIILAIDTGLRQEEMFSLMWPQVDLPRHSIATTEDTKSGRKRVVPISARSAQYLAQARAAQTVGNVASLYVLCHEDGSRIGRVRKGFEAAARRAGVEDLRWHDLRRTAGCRWLQRDGLSIDKVSMLLGHSSVVVTQRSYAFLRGEDIIRDMAAQNSAQE